MDALLDWTGKKPGQSAGAVPATLTGGSVVMVNMLDIEAHGEALCGRTEPLEARMRRC
jgi:hypothetical protein